MILIVYSSLGWVNKKNWFGALCTRVGLALGLSGRVSGQDIELGTLCWASPSLEEFKFFAWGLRWGYKYLEVYIKSFYYFFSSFPAEDSFFSTEPFRISLGWVCLCPASSFTTPPSSFGLPKCWWQTPAPFSPSWCIYHIFENSIFYF